VPFTGKTVSDSVGAGTVSGDSRRYRALMPSGIKALKAASYGPAHIGAVERKDHEVLGDVGVHAEESPDRDLAPGLFTDLSSEGMDRVLASVHLTTRHFPTTFVQNEQDTTRRVADQSGHRNDVVRHVAQDTSDVPPSVQ